MGVNWSSDEDDKDREDKAAEALHELVWDKSSAIGRQKIEKVLSDNMVTSCSGVTSVINAMRNSRAEQNRKVLLYLKNNAIDWADFHTSISNRYTCVVNVLNKKMWPNSPESILLTQEEEPS